MSHIIPKLDPFQVFVKDCVRTTRVKLKKLCYRTDGTKAYTIELGRTWEICEALKNLSRSQPSPHGVIRNCEKDDKKLGTRKAVNESNECELVTAASLWNELPGKKSRYKHCKIYLQKKYRCKVSPCLWFEKRSSLTRYCAKKVQ